MNPDPTERLKEIISSIVGPRPGLYIPVGYKREVGRLGPHVGVFYRYSDVFPGVDCAQKYCETVSRLPFEYALLSFVAINNALLKSHFDRDVHGFLETICVRPECLSQFQRFSKEHLAPDSRLVFHGANCMLNVKALLTVPERLGCVDPYLIGDLALAGNEFMSGHQFREEAARPDDLDLVVEFASTWDLYNPVEIANGISRVAVMMDSLCGTDPAVVWKRQEIGIDPATLKFDDLPLSAYQAVIFGLWAHVSTPPANAVLENPGVCAFERTKFLKKVNLPQQYLDTFLARRSCTIQELRQKLKDSTGRNLLELLEDQNFTTDFTVFRQHPVVDLGTEKHLVLDCHFLAELLVYGLYWQIFDGLLPEKREDFSSLWGELFEQYVRDLMSSFYGISPISPLKQNVLYEGGEVDALLDFGPIAVLFECKASLLSRAAKYNRNRVLFEKEICAKFVENERGKPKALRQLANAVAAAIDGKLSIGGNAKIYPVLITYEPILESFGINEYLNSLFQMELQTQDPRIWPLTVLSIDELEEVLPHFEQNDWDWAAFFSERFGDHRRVPGYSVHQSLYNFGRSNAIPRRPNQFVMKTFETVYNSILQEYHGETAE